MISWQLIRGFWIDWDKINETSYLRNINPIKDLSEFQFDHPATSFVGENGKGFAGPL